MGSAGRQRAVRLGHRLFPESLEKGVILRGGCADLLASPERPGDCGRRLRSVRRGRAAAGRVLTASGDCPLPEDPSARKDVPPRTAGYFLPPALAAGLAAGLAPLAGVLAAAVSAAPSPSSSSFFFFFFFFMASL